METVLLYQIKGTKTAVLLKPVLLKRGIRVRIVEPEQYLQSCLLYTSPSPRDYAASRMPSSA